MTISKLQDVLKYAVRMADEMKFVIFVWVILSLAIVATTGYFLSHFQGEQYSNYLALAIMLLIPSVYLCCGLIMNEKQRYLTKHHMIRYFAIDDSIISKTELHISASEALLQHEELPSTTTNFRWEMTQGA
jgi:hypothetical protein